MKRVGTFGARTTTIKFIEFNKNIASDILVVINETELFRVIFAQYVSIFIHDLDTMYFYKYEIKIATF